MRKLSMLAGFFLFVSGIFLIWMLYGFASMMDPDSPVAASEWAIWRRVFADGSFPVGIILIVAGAWLALSRPKRPV